MGLLGRDISGSELCFNLGEPDFGIGGPEGRKLDANSGRGAPGIGHVVPSPVRTSGPSAISQVQYASGSPMYIYMAF